MPIPDVDLHYQLQYDKTARPNNAMHGVSVGVQLPLWNRNQGGIREAAANLSRAADEPQRVRNDLTVQVAAALERYNNNRALAQMYRDQIVPDQVRAYRNVYRRYDTEPEALNFNDVITTSRPLAETIRNYVESLGNLWDSVVDLAGLLQKDELFDGDGQPGPQRCLLPELEWLPAPAGSTSGAGPPGGTALLRGRGAGRGPVTERPVRRRASRSVEEIIEEEGVQFDGKVLGGRSKAQSRA